MRTAQIWLDQFFPIFNSTISPKFRDKVSFQLYSYIQVQDKVGFQRKVLLQV